VSFAKAVVSGVVVSEPEKRFTPNNHAVTSFFISVEAGGGIPRPGAGNEPFQVKVTCWRNLADAVASQVLKGEQVLVEGKLILNTYQTQDGVQKRQYEIEAVSVSKLSGAPELIVPAVAVAGTPSSAGAAYPSPPPMSSSPAYATMPPSSVAAPSSGGFASSGGHFSSEDLLTEDDIPF
jgi:single-strand DNA-binding protein